MYSWLWSKLPGGNLAKVLVLATGLAAVVFALFAWGFPALDLWSAQNPVVSD